VRLVCESTKRSSVRWPTSAARAQRLESYRKPVQNKRAVLSYGRRSKKPKLTLAVRGSVENAVGRLGSSRGQLCISRAAECARLLTNSESRNHRRRELLTRRNGTGSTWRTNRVALETERSAETQTVRNNRATRRAEQLTNGQANQLEEGFASPRATLQEIEILLTSRDRCKLLIHKPPR
jgi:hypothetical protein